MEQQTTNPTTTDQQDRTLTITVTPTLIWNGEMESLSFGGVSMSYAQTDSNPNMPNVVDPVTGNISLRAMPANNNFTDNVDITFNLDDSAAQDPEGDSVQVRFATTTESNADGTGPIWFCATPTPGNPKNPAQIANPPGMSIGENSPTQAYINDDQADGGSSYSFCFGVVVPYLSSTPYTVDPVITGKGENMAFMLKD